MSSAKTPNEVIAAYRPTVISKDRWQTIAPFVREQVTAAADPNWTPDQTRNALRIVTRFVDYASITGRPLTVESVFIDSLVTAFVHHELDYTTHVKGSARATLRAVAKTVNPDFDGPRNTPEYGTDKKLAPYSAQDIAALRQWAAGETTQERRDQAELLLAFGLGAGLRACEVATLTDQDIEADEHGVVLYPSGYRGASKRFVPVEAEWSEVIMRAVTGARLLGRGCSARAGQARRQGLSRCSQSAPPTPQMQWTLDVPEPPGSSTRLRRACPSPQSARPPAWLTSSTTERSSCPTSTPLPARHGHCFTAVPTGLRDGAS